MSEPMSSVEIEDVLSSIRRLVSEEVRTVPKTAVQAALAQPPVADPNKLILTPALRVVPEADPMALEGVVAQVGAAVDRHADDWEPEGGDAPLMFDVDPMEDVAWSDFVIEDETLSAPLVVQTPTLDEPVPIVDTFVSRRVHLAASPKVDEVPTWAQTDKDCVVPEAENNEDQSNIEPDLAWADAVEADLIAKLEAEDSVAATTPDLSAKDEMRFNESVLRDLVRDIIRDELQGELGERITRNIRKLVRVEIARAMATQSYQ